MTDRFCDVGRDVTLCYRTHGDPAGEPLLLIAGLGLDLTSWPDGIVDGLVRTAFTRSHSTTATPVPRPGSLPRRRDGCASWSRGHAATPTTWPTWPATPWDCSTILKSGGLISSACPWAA
jgi:hypothetical protein